MFPPPPASTQVKLLEYYDEEEQLNFRRTSLVFGDAFLLKGNLYITNVQY